MIVFRKTSPPIAARGSCRLTWPAPSTAAYPERPVNPGEALSIRRDHGVRWGSGPARSPGKDLAAWFSGDGTASRKSRSCPLRVLLHFIPESSPRRATPLYLRPASYKRRSLSLNIGDASPFIFGVIGTSRPRSAIPPAEACCGRAGRARRTAKGISVP